MGLVSQEPHPNRSAPYQFFFAASTVRRDYLVMQESKRKEGDGDKILNFSRLQEEHAKVLNRSYKVVCDLVFTIAGHQTEQGED